MKNLITSDNLTFTKKKCNCGLKINKVNNVDTKTNKRKVSKNATRKIHQ
jgi:hypothetical protein